MRWIPTASEILANEPSCVRVVVARIKGSTPREAGANMLIGKTTVMGTIGGGMLEFQAIEKARTMLAMAAPAPSFVNIPLGPNLGQCCGGQVTLCYQPLTAANLAALTAADPEKQHFVTRDSMSPDHYRMLASGDLGSLGISQLAADRLGAGTTPEMLKTDDGMILVEPPQPRRPQLCLFGAGHVGRELVHVLGRHDVDIHWIDQRKGEFPLSFPSNTRPLALPDPMAFVALAPAGADWLVMTHDHALDLQLCDAILRRGDFRFFGLIGSETKHTRFRKRLAEAGHDASTIARITCPIGLPEIQSKRPEVIAVSVAAELLCLPEIEKMPRQFTGTK